MHFVHRNEDRNVCLCFLINADISLLPLPFLFHGTYCHFEMTQECIIIEYRDLLGQASPLALFSCLGYN